MCSLLQRAARQYDPASYGLTAKLIELNPDFYTLWNFRKEIVLDCIAKTPAERSSLLNAELDLSFKALLKNPKCYSAWHHRLWVLDLDAEPVDREMALCTKMLTMDARNFHCWNYRRAVAERAKATPQSEFEFTTTKINENFSNYSAWHYRTVLIPRIYSHAWLEATDASPAERDQRRHAYDEFIDAEFQLVKGAFYTEPEDQSAWLYHRWLLGRVVATSTGNQLPVLGISLGTHLFEETNPMTAAAATASNTTPLDASSVDAVASQLQSSQLSSFSPSSAAPAAAAAAAAAPSSAAASASPSSLSRQLCVFHRELLEVQELLTVEENCKWALLTTAILQAGILACVQEDATLTANATTPIPSAAELSTGIRAVFDRLLHLDPMRKQYYEDVRKRFLQQ